MSDDTEDLKNWADQYGRVRRANDRATRWAGGVGEKFPMHPEKLHPTTVPTLQTSQFGPTTHELGQRGADADSERYDYTANPGNRITKHGLSMWHEDAQAGRSTVDARSRVDEGKLTAREYDSERDRKVRAGDSAHNLSTMAMQDSHGEGAPDSMLGQAREASSRLREFSHFDQSSPPGGASGAIMASIFVGKEGLQHGGARGASDLIRESTREIWKNPLRHGRN